MCVYVLVYICVWIDNGTAEFTWGKIYMQEKVLKCAFDSDPVCPCAVERMLKIQLLTPLADWLRVPFKWLQSPDVGRQVPECWGIFRVLAQLQFRLTLEQFLKTSRGIKNSAKYNAWDVCVLFLGHVDFSFCVSASVYPALARGPVFWVWKQGLSVVVNERRTHGDISVFVCTSPYFSVTFGDRLNIKIKVPPFFQSPVVIDWIN